jgi:hypothetical protein
MKKELLLVIILGIIIIVLAGVLLFMPRQAKTPVVINAEGLQIDSPKSGQEVSSPLEITGITNGWNGFEGQVGTVQLLDYKGNKVTEGILTATTDWTKPPVNFKATLTFSVKTPGPMTLLFKSENPSGDPASDKTISLPIIVK